VRPRRKNTPVPGPTDGEHDEAIPRQNRGDHCKILQTPSAARHPSWSGNKVADKTLPRAGGLWKHKRLVSKTVGPDKRTPKDLNP
jgi:hypothetical protein